MDKESYNTWRKEAQNKLLTDIAPRIGYLGTVFYTGCGFHYDMERRLGNLIVALHLPLADQGKDQHLDVVYQVCYDALCDSVVKAENSVQKCQKIIDAIDDNLAKEN